MSSDTASFAVQVMGALVAIIPLFITPVVMKTAGGLLNRFGGVVNNPNKGPFDRMRKGADGYRKNRQNLRDMRALNGAGQGGRGRAVRWNARRNAINSGRESEMKRANTEYIAGEAETNSAFRNAAAGGTGLQLADEGASQRSLANAINIQAKLEADEVSAAKAVIEHAELSGAERQILATTGSVSKNGVAYNSKTMQKAAIQEQLRTGSMGDIHALVESSGSSLREFSQTIAQGVASNGVASRNPALGGKTLDLIEQGKIGSKADLDVVIEGAISEGKFSADSLATMHDVARERVIDVARASTNPDHIAALRTAATTLLATPELVAKISGNKTAETQITSI